ncbi:MAG: MFS transporter, partial [Thermoplasmata archaeon]
LRIWGKIADSFSNKSVLSISSPIFLISILAWTFTTMPKKHVLSIPLLIIIHILMGMSLAGVNLASKNISLKLAPKKAATSYLASHSIINSISAGIAPIIGGGLADFFANRELDWKLIYRSPNGYFDIPMLSFQQWDFFFFFAFLIGLYSIHRLAKINEVGEIEKKVVLQKFFAEAKKPIRNFACLNFTYPLIKIKIRRNKVN